MSKIRADKFVNNAANGAPQLTYGAEVPVGYGITGAGGINITGSVTAPSFSGSGSGLSGIDATTLKDSGGSVKVQGNTSGVVVTGVSTFSGNVSVGGVITYEDVTSIDSVGIITARDGIKIGAGQSVSAVSGIVTYYGDGSKLSGVESGVVNFVASGTIANGATVIIKTDGTVGIVTTTTSNTPSAGTPVVFNAGNSSYLACTYDPDNGKVVIAYVDYGNNSYGTAIVGTVSGDTISFGSEVVFESAHTEHVSIAYDTSHDKVVIAYRDRGNSDHGTAIVGTVSGTSISFGSPVVYHANNTNMGLIVYDSTNEKVVIAYNNASATDASAIVGTVSGTSISFGSPGEFTSAGTGQMGITYDSTNSKVVIFFSDGNDSFRGAARVGTVSGTSISFGSVTAYSSTQVGGQPAIYDPVNQKVLVAYKEYSDSSKGKAVVGTVSGTSISFGTPVIFHNYGVGAMNEMSLTYDPDTGKVFLSFFDSNNSNYGTTKIGTISGTSISFGSAVAWNSSNTGDMSSIYDTTNDKLVIAYKDSGNSNHGTAVVFSATSQTTNLTAENYIGIAAEAISNTATGKINVVTGTNTGQTGLTTAQKYFVQPNGTLGTSAGSPSVVAGTAISDTKILVR